MIPLFMLCPFPRSCYFWTFGRHRVRRWRRPRQNICGIPNSLCKQRTSSYCLGARQQNVKSGEVHQDPWRHKLSAELLRWCRRRVESSYRGFKAREINDLFMWSFSGRIRLGLNFGIDKSKGFLKIYTYRPYWTLHIIKILSTKMDYKV